MIKIDREKLIELINEYCDYNNGNTKCKKCVFFIENIKKCKTLLIADLLESHPELIVSDRIEAPVITTYSLKQEYKLLLRYYTGSIIDNKMISVPEEFKKYYDLETELDYSKIEVGTVVEINNFNYIGAVYNISQKSLGLRSHINAAIDVLYVSFSDIKSLTILKLPEVRE